MTTHTRSKHTIIASIIFNCIIITILAIFGIAVLMAFSIFAGAGFFGFGLTTCGGVAANIASDTFLQGLVMSFGDYAQTVTLIATGILGFIDLIIFIAIALFSLNVKEIVQKAKIKKAFK